MSALYKTWEGDSSQLDKRLISASFMSSDVMVLEAGPGVKCLVCSVCHVNKNTQCHLNCHLYCLHWFMEQTQNSLHWKLGQNWNIAQFKTAVKSSFNIQ